jgi:peptidoglycan/xylan/chitin deacetylase (PgdA/CDA1 family)
VDFFHENERRIAMKRKILCLVLAALLLSATGCGQKNTTLYVLMYHNFALDGQECNEWTTTKSKFAMDLQWLTDHGYSFVTPSQLASGKSLPKKAVMLTFDDGYASNYEIAFPLLKQYNAKAALALITKRLEDGKEGFLTWEMCQEMADSGYVEIGSHTHDVHILVDQGVARNEGETQEEYNARVLPDIQTSIDLIQEKLGITPQYFAYPYGRTDEWATDFVQSNFAVTVTTDAGVADISDGLYNMPRHNINATTDLSSFMPE